MPDDPVSKADFEVYRQMHHSALGDITRVTAGMQATLETISNHLVGTLDKPGLAHRVAALECSVRGTWWRERGTKVVDALILAIVVVGLVFLLKVGFQAAIRDIIRSSASDFSMALDVARKAPKDPVCPGCAPTVAAAE